MNSTIIAAATERAGLAPQLLEGQIEGVKVRSLEEVFRALQEADARYLVVGGLAVIAHGYVRITTDLNWF